MNEKEEKEWDLIVEDVLAIAEKILPKEKMEKLFFTTEEMSKAKESNEFIAKTIFSRILDWMKFRN